MEGWSFQFPKPERPTIRRLRFTLSRTLAAVSKLVDVLYAANGFTSGSGKENGSMADTQQLETADAHTRWLEQLLAA